MSGEDFLSRWSRRKHQARRDGGAAQEPPLPAAVPPPADPGPDARETAPAAAVEPPLPAVETLTPQSDFTPFMKPEVDGDVRRDALKALFRDPQFNVMDGLDTYIDDYSKPDPLPDGWLEKMNQVARLGAWKDPDAPPEAVPGTPPSPASSDPADTAAAPAEVAPAVAPPEPPQTPETIELQSDISNHDARQEHR